MTPLEKRAAWSLASLLGLRMLGFFMVLPVFALYASEYVGSTPLMIGLAIGVYGLTQAVFQVPFGMLSDRFGRRPVIAAGIVMLVLGSIVAATADHIGWVVAGRAVQGLGAISGAAMALAADLSRESQRTKMMAIIGISIGASFALATVLGPALSASSGMPGVFWCTALLAALGLGVLWFVVPEPDDSRLRRDTQPVLKDLGTVLRDRRLLLLDAGILLLHFLMPATFVVLPLELRDTGGIPADAQWMVYPPVMILAVFAMWPGIRMSDKQNRPRAALAGAAIVLLVTELALALRLDLPGASGWLWLGLCMVAFFAAFTVIESVLPALVSRVAPATMKGTALGAFSTAQYLGAFLGGVLGGTIHQFYGATAVFSTCALVALAWLALVLRLEPPEALTIRLVPIGNVSAPEAIAIADRLRAVPGVAEATVIAEDGLAYLKVDRQRCDIAALDEIAAGRA